MSADNLVQSVKVKTSTQDDNRAELRVRVREVSVVNKLRIVGENRHLEEQLVR